MQSIKEIKEMLKNNCFYTYYSPNMVTSHRVYDVRKSKGKLQIRVATGTPIRLIWLDAVKNGKIYQQ